MNDDDPIPPERLARAEALVRGTGAEPPPYPSREATDVRDAIGLAAYELLTDPGWIARHWLPPDPVEGGDHE